MVRHGYINCTACHVSPAGGGLTTTYGRSISKELLSRWGREGEENVGHGLIKNESVVNWINGSREVGFNIGGDVRYLQTRKDTPFVEEGKFIPMQRDFEGAFKYNNFQIVSTLGVIERDERNHWDSRRVYGLYQVNDNLTVRAGRFIPIYGLMIPDHNMATRKGLGFDQGRERNAFEVNYIKDNWSGTLTASKSPESRADALEEKGLSGQLNYAFLDKHKVGVNAWVGDFKDDRKRQIYGVHAILGFTHEIYTLSEVDYQKTTSSLGGVQEGFFYYQKLGYEFTRGLHAILQFDGSQTDFRSDQTASYSYGAGLMFFPRPHFDFQGFWTRSKIKAVDNDEFDFAYLMLHYYL